MSSNQIAQTHGNIHLRRVSEPAGRSEMTKTKSEDINLKHLLNEDNALPHTFRQRILFFLYVNSYPILIKIYLFHKSL